MLLSTRSATGLLAFSVAKLTAAKIAIRLAARKAAPCASERVNDWLPKWVR